MKKNMFLKVTLLTLVLCLSFSFLVSADDNDQQLMGDFRIEKNQNIRINSQDYVPFEEVAEILDYDYDWKLVDTSVKGHLNNQTFKSDSFMIAYGYLYLPVDSYEDLFDIKIVVKGKRYYVYLLKPYPPVIPNLELVIQTDSTKYKRHEPIAVSLLLLNNSDRSHTLRFNSGKKFDLILKRYNTEIWRLSDNMAYIQSLSFEVIKQDDYRLFTILIEPGKDRYLNSAEYTLEAEINTTNGIILSDELEVEIY